MSSKHLQTGDARPVFDNAKKFRIYSMKFCPFAQRPRLVVSAKGLKDFDIVNIKLRDDLPEWYPSINPFRKVPAIEFPDGDSVYGSLVLCDMLDELYPEKQLHPKDPKEKAKQKLYIEQFGETFIPSIHKHSSQGSEETKEEVLKNVGNAEKYLAENKSKYFAGSEAGMLDYMMWPWFERLPMILTLSADVHPNLTNWYNLMQNDPAVKETMISKENYLKFYDGYKKGQVDYDFV